eukprot:TRINITY_DN43671_c0_g1_i1.p1 TRINITY_DN43671_c0_g1~~TRINITY_DN43671_c0_g1_i1.p1  ORF type:complete len:270 (+),score=43.06 TRINITY_DN43671_c0_g1_i1:19-828(+)
MARRRLKLRLLGSIGFALCSAGILLRPLLVPAFLEGNWHRPACRQGRCSSLCLQSGPAHGMLFTLPDMGFRIGKEGFIKDTIKSLCDATDSSEISVVEWEPGDQRGLKYLGEYDGELVRHISVMRPDKDLEKTIDEFISKIPTYLNTDCLFESWEAGEKLDIPDGVIDVVLLQPGSAMRFGGAKTFLSLLKESSRVLKPRGQMIAFLEDDSGESLPDTAMLPLSLNRTMSSDGVTCYLLDKRKLEKPRKVKPGRKAPTTAAQGRTRRKG